MKKILTLCILLGITSTLAFAQKQYQLKEIIQLAQGQSPNSLQAQNRKENRYWRYRTYLSNYKPQLSINGTLPDFSRSILQNRNDDGSIGFVEISNFNIDTRLSLRQTIAATGGEIFISSQLARLENLTGSNQGIQYASNPVQIGFRQPLFGFNDLKWDKKIEPLRYEESQKSFNEDMERVAIQATGLFFDLLVGQINFEIASTNFANNDTIFQIGKGRFNLGKIAENDLLQLQLNVMNASQQVTQAKLDIETSQLILKAYLGNNDIYNNISLIEPTNIPEFTIDPEIAIAQAKANRQQYVSFKRQKLEAERDVARARGDNGLNVDLFGSFGLTKQGNTIPDAYNQLQDQQTLTIGFEIPILDWGRQKSQIRTALANEELVKSTISQDEITFEQEVYLKVKQLDILRERLKIATQSDTIAQRRYYIAQQRYLISKISITDLNIALQEKDIAKRGYLSALRNFWLAYYEIRQLTLYDFEENTPIRYSVD